MIINIQDSLFPGRNSNRGALEHEILGSRPTFSAKFGICDSSVQQVWPPPILRNGHCSETLFLLLSQNIVEGSDSLQRSLQSANYTHCTLKAAVFWNVTSCGLVGGT